jgi:hypothetical protein
VIHPFLVAIFPILGLFAKNSTQVPYSDLLMPTALAIGGSFVIWLIVTGLLGNAQKAGLFTTIGLVFFYTSGRLPQLADSWLSDLSDYWVKTDVVTPPRLVFLAAFALVMTVGLFLTSRLKHVGTWTRLLNLFALVLILFPIGQVIRTGRLPRGPRQLSGLGVTLKPMPSRHPDIYYIILDGYARSDVMQELFNFDNTGFLDRLRHKGFFLARSSTSNYCQTPLSLSSSLNLDYLDDLVSGSENDLTSLHELIGRNRLAAMLRSLNYKFVTFSTGFEPSDVIDSDRYLSPYHQFTEYQRLLVDQTPLWAFLSLAESRDLFTQARDRTIYLLDHLPEVAEDPRPTFALAHIVCPHPPFLFGEKGQDVSRRDERYYLSDGCRYQGFTSNPEVYIRGYRDQAIYITRRIEQVIDQILARSTEPPVLILQADHGSGLRLVPESKEKTDLHERMSILNAYYFPDHNYEALYPEITPVNSFRVVLNNYFGAGLPLLPDRNFFSTWSHPFEFMDVTSVVQAPACEVPTAASLASGPLTEARSEVHSVRR